MPDDYYLSACMSIVRWVILRHTQGLNSEVLSDEEGDSTLKSLPQIKPTQIKDNVTEESANPDASHTESKVSDSVSESLENSESKDSLQQSNSKVEVTDSETKTETLKKEEIESRETLPQIVLPAVTTNKDGPKTSRKGNHQRLFV